MKTTDIKAGDLVEFIEDGTRGGLIKGNRVRVKRVELSSNPNYSPTVYYDWSDSAGRLSERNAFITRFKKVNEEAEKALIDMVNNVMRAKQTVSDQEIDNALAEAVKASVEASWKELNVPPTWYAGSMAYAINNRRLDVNSVKPPVFVG